MSRSKYKLSYVHRSLFNDVIENKIERNFRLKMLDNNSLKKKLDNNYYFFVRYSNVNEDLIGKRIGIYNGKAFIFYDVMKDSVGFKLGDFASTRKKAVHAGKIKQQKKVKKVERLLPGMIPASVRLPVRKQKVYFKKKKKKKKKYTRKRKRK